MTPIRIMTYNTRSCKLKNGKHSPEKIAEIIQSASPDVVALQEMDKGLASSQGQDQAQIIADKLGAQMGFAKRLELEGGAYGLAIISRIPFEIRKVDSIQRIAPGRRGEKTIAFWISFFHDGREIHLMNTHFVHCVRHRRDAVQQLTGDAWRGAVPREAPLVVCGDFNSMFFSPIIMTMKKFFVDVVKKDKSRNWWKRLFLTTWPASYPFVRIDYVFASHHFDVLSTYAYASQGAKEASDHLPFVADLKLKEISHADS